jgi:hypothetical protein
MGNGTFELGCRTASRIEKRQSTRACSKDSEGEVEEDQSYVCGL